MKTYCALWKENVIFALFVAMLSSVPSRAVAAEHWESRATGIPRRTGNSAVWTGREMIVWGGGSQSVWLNDGGVYHFESNTWRATSQQGAPAPRWFHGAAWSGTEMLIFGGRASFYDQNVHNDGGRYNPVTDTWSPLSSSNAPAPRSQFASVWTGTEFIVWGGFGGGNTVRGDGGRYNPTTDIWTPMSNVNAPAGRAEPTAVWTGTEMIVFGGIAGSGGSEHSFNTGARYNPTTDTWTPLPTNGAPRVTGHTAVWTGTDMIVWGGRLLPEHQFVTTGARYNPADNSWHPIASTSLIEPRIYQAATWTGREMIIWGGTAWPPQVIFGNGARYRPASDSWVPMTSENAAYRRMMWRPDLTIWTGFGMLLYGGSDYPYELDSTDLYVPDVVDGPPRILSQSSSQTVDLGETVTLKVTAVGTEPLAYQWQHNGTTLPDATEATLTLADVQLNEAGDYVVIVTNELGSITSSNIHLTVVSNTPSIRITSFTPPSGPVGTTVTLTGEGFNPTAGDNSVRINGQIAAVTAATESTLTVTVPPGTTYGSFSVTANGLTAESRLGFVVTFPVRALNAAAFGTASIFSPGVYPTPTDVADLDGDGRPDLVEVNHFNIGIYRNDGTGNVAGLFTLVLSLPTAEIPGDIRLGDIDGDGQLDIVAVNYSEGSVSVFRNTTTNGLIAFAPKVSFPLTDARSYIAVADLDGDGRLDILAPSFNGGNIRVLRNTSGPGSISFAPPVDFPTMANPSCVAVRDLNGDGKPDVVVLHHVGSITALVVMQNVSTPGVINSGSLPITATLNANGNYVVIADLDSDGRPDIVAGAIYTHNLTVIQNLSTNGNLSGSAFGPPATLPTAGVTKRIGVSDLDGDGRVDLIAATELSDSVGVFRNVGGTNGINASWFAPRFDLAAGWNADGVSVSDFDFDGLPDIVFCSLYANEVWIYRGTQPPPPPPPPPPPVLPIQIANFSPLSGPVGTTVTLTGTGFNPVVVSNIVAISGVRATITAVTESNLIFTVPPGATYGRIVVTANGLSAESSGAFDVTFPPRTIDPSAFDTPLKFSPGDGPIATRVADLDGDGRPDLAVANFYGNTVSIYRNSGTGGVANVFSPKIDLSTGSNPFDLHLADIDGDGQLDIVVLNLNDDNISVMRNLSSPGSISFAAQKSFYANFQPHNGAVGDVDGDGRPEVIITSFENGDIVVLRNTSSPGDIDFEEFRHIYATGPGAHGVGIQDLDSDGRADVVVASHSQSTPAIVVLQNIGNPGHIDEESFRIAAQLDADGTYVVFGDFDGDGRQDIVTCSWYDHSVSLFQNLSTPGSLSNNSFGPRIRLPSAGSTKRIAVTDIDGDGRADLAFPTELGDSVGIYRNGGGSDALSASWFAPRVDLASGWNGDGISIGDIDLDGLPDIVFCSFYIDEVWIYRGIRPTPPAMVTQPTDVTVPLGVSATLSVSATGGGLQYQWYFNGEELVEANGPTLTFANTSSGYNGDYFVVVWNATGSVTSQVATLTVVVERLLEIGAVPGVNEGELISAPLLLVSHGDVGGLEFTIDYNPAHLAVPEIIWSSVLDGALKEWGISDFGHLRGVIALPATTISAGTQSLATVQFRARTVFATSAAALGVSIVGVSDSAGDPIVGGTDTLGHGFNIIDTGSFLGDNNANHQLDVGDASLLMRLLAQLDFVRSFDVPANDFNLNQRLDSGDVIKMLRVIAGIDPPPQPQGSNQQTVAKSLTKSADSEAASISPARLTGTNGQLVTYEVRLDIVRTLISGASFTLNYQTNALRLRNAQSHRVGPAVPGGALAVWNVAPSQNDYAAQNGNITLALSSSTPWSASNSVLAEFTFEVQAGATNQHLWPLTINALEITGNGFNNRTLGPLRAGFVGRAALSGRMTRVLVTRGGDVSFSFNGDTGASYQIDYSEDLINWLPLREVQDASGTIQIIDSAAGSRPQRFYRNVPLP